VFIPVLRYRDAKAAIGFLVDAFGFEARLVVEGDGGLIEHAQLVHGDGMVMLGSARDDEYSRLIGLEGDATQSASSLYVMVDDVTAHAEHTRRAGAEILIEPSEQYYGGSDYTTRDPEGNVWSFGSDNPWDGGD
jgi:uncharacterized glyoxalase superfamily protein PhnB